MTNCGIYKIENIINNKIYIGSSHDLKGREQQHFYLLRNNKHHNAHLTNAVKKYGIANFKFSIVEEISEIENISELKEYILQRENYWINTSNKESLYNIRLIAESNLGISTGRRTKEFSRLMSSIKKGQVPWMKNKKHSEKSILKIRHKRKLQVITEEHKQRLSESLKGRSPWNIGIPLSEVTKNKMNKTRLNWSKKYKDEVYKTIHDKCKKKVKNLTTGEVFDSIKEASEYFGANSSCISQVCKGKGKTHKGYKWSYYE